MAKRNLLIILVVSIFLIGAAALKLGYFEILKFELPEEPVITDYIITDYIKEGGRILYKGKIIGGADFNSFVALNYLLCQR